MKRPILVFCLWITLGSSAWAGNWRANYVLSYQVGDSETRTTLRTIALDEARTKASNEVGMVVLNKQELKDDTLTEQTKLVSASMIKLKVLRESPRVDSGATYVDFVIEAQVDDSELDKQLDAMRADVRKSDSIARLSRENAALRTRLAELRAALGGSRNEDESARMNRDLTAAFADVSSIENEVVLSLAPGRLAPAQHKVVEEANQELIDAVVMGPLLNAKVHITVKAPRQKEERIEVPVDLAWDLDIEAMKRGSLNFSTPHPIDYGSASRGFCADTITHTEGQTQIGRQLLNDAVAIEVRIGDTKSYFTIGGEDEQGRFCVADGSFAYQKTVVVSITESDSQLAETVSAQVVRMSTLGARWKSMLRNDLLMGGL